MRDKKTMDYKQILECEKNLSEESWIYEKEFNKWKLKKD